MLTKLIYNSLPRRLIDNTNDKAILVTGIFVVISLFGHISSLLYHFTGCDSGFGHALAIKLDGIGFKVYAGCLNVRGEGAQQLKTKCSDRMHLVPLDVTKHDQVSAATHLVASTLENRSQFTMMIRSYI